MSGGQWGCLQHECSGKGSRSEKGAVNRGRKRWMGAAEMTGS